MKNTIEELQLANTVRDFAKELRHAAQVQALTIDSTKLEREAFDAARADWLSHHPIDEFIPAAVAELKRIADITIPLL